MFLRKIAGKFNFFEQTQIDIKHMKFTIWWNETLRVLYVNQKTLVPKQFVPQTLATKILIPRYSAEAPKPNQLSKVGGMPRSVKTVRPRSGRISNHFPIFQFIRPPWAVTLQKTLPGTLRASPDGPQNLWKLVFVLMRNVSWFPICVDPMFLFRSLFTPPKQSQGPTGHI